MDSEGWRTVQPRRRRTASLRPHQPSPPQRAQVYLPYSPPTYAQVLVAPPPTAYLPAPTTQLPAPTTTQRPAHTDTAVPHHYQPNFPPPPNLAPHPHLTTLPLVPVIPSQAPLANSAFSAPLLPTPSSSPLKHTPPHRPSFSFHPLALLFYISHLPRTTLNGATAAFTISAGATFEVTANFHPLVPAALVLATPTTPAPAKRTVLAPHMGALGCNVTRLQRLYAISPSSQPLHPENRRSNLCTCLSNQCCRRTNQLMPLSKTRLIEDACPIVTLSTKSQTFKSSCRDLILPPHRLCLQTMNDLTVFLALFRVGRITLPRSSGCTRALSSPCPRILKLNSPLIKLRTSLHQPV